MNRIDTLPSVNGTINTAKPATPRKSHKSNNTAAKDSKRVKAAKKTVRFCTAYTALAIVLSSALNGYAASLSGENITAKCVGAILGGSVPVLVWLLAQVTAYTYRAGYNRLSLIPAGVSIALLILSVTHCSSAFAELTGTSAFLSICLAVGIDCGLVSSEAVSIIVSVE